MVFFIAAMGKDSIRSISRHMKQYCPRRPAYIGETYQCEIGEREGFKSKSDIKRHQQSTSVRKNSYLGRRMRHQQRESSDMTGLMDWHAQVLNPTLINPSNDVASRVSNGDDLFVEVPSVMKRKKSTTKKA
jgi:hypothetical protein